jgi:hypothetical protein
MKHQYFGDINDFRKYGLLRILTAKGVKRLGICWMLTEDDNRTDGNFTRYLSEPHRWRVTDPKLFDTLAAGVAGTSVRRISERLLEPLLPNTIFAAEMIPDNAQERARSMAQIVTRFHDRDLVFLDPDNGLEVRSVRKGNKKSNKYLYWDEVAAFWRIGASVLVYQHFPREKRDSFTARIAGKMREVTGVHEIHTFATANVTFLFAPRRGEEHWYRERSNAVENLWSVHFTHDVHSD